MLKVKVICFREEIPPLIETGSRIAAELKYMSESNINWASNTLWINVS